MQGIELLQTQSGWHNLPPLATWYKENCEAEQCTLGWCLSVRLTLTLASYASIDCLCPLPVARIDLLIYQYCLVSTGLWLLSVNIKELVACLSGGPGICTSSKGLFTPGNMQSFSLEVAKRSREGLSALLSIEFRFEKGVHIALNDQKYLILKLLLASLLLQVKK